MGSKSILLILYIGFIRWGLLLNTSGTINRNLYDTIPQFAGLLQYTVKVLDTIWAPQTKPIFTVPAKIWYVDSTAIEENASLNTLTDSKNKTTVTIKILNYRFVDLRKKWIYVYSSFSDTARMIKKYSFSDKSVETIGGWNFTQKKEINYIGEPMPMTDSTIDGVIYKRQKIIGERLGKRFFVELYFRCDRPVSIFTLDTRLSKKIACPCVKSYSEFFKNPKRPFLLEIDFLRDELTEEELNVFRTWANYAAKDPVTH